ncbi:MAG TPA: LacI family DNA-binding transcriptional regulator [Flavisolibacter sp.]|jgi:LacI family transcriptional regulator|nr:LacI family DNA-binding transcriptional regulator [Flavisolibacter sp.]
MKSVNLKELASHLNLSISTVSRALNDSYEVNDETKKRVQEMAAALNYQPNPYASSLRRQKSRTIALIIPEIANNFFTLAIDGIESIAQQHGYHVLIYLTHEDSKKEAEITQLLQNGRVDGILMSLSSNTADNQHLGELHEKKIPLVFFDRVSESYGLARVTTDDYESGYKATTHLIEQGCERIAHLTISENLSICKKRMQGYIKALEDHGKTVDPTLIINCNEDAETNYSFIKQLLEREGRPDGIFASVEKLAIYTYEACAALKLSIPDDIKVISFSNLATAALLHPSLTTITQPAFDIGKEAASILFRAIRSKPIPSASTVCRSVLIKRESTGVAK